MKNFEKYTILTPTRGTHLNVYPWWGCIIPQFSVDFRLDDVIEASKEVL